VLRIALEMTNFAGATRGTGATCGAIRLKLLKIGALVRISVRRIQWPWRRPWSAGDLLERDASPPCGPAAKRALRPADTALRCSAQTSRSR
jgi:hypothetical protein